MPENRPTLSRLFLFLTLFLLTSIQIFAQTAEQKRSALKAKILSDKKVKDVFYFKNTIAPSSIMFDFASPAYKQSETPSLLRDYLSLRPGYDNLESVKTTIVNKNIAIDEYQQYFKGVRVAYSRYKAMAKNDNLLILAGDFYDVPASLSVTPSITEARALEIAKGYVGAKKYAWEQVQEMINQEKNEKVKQLLQAELKEYLPKAELVVVKDFTNKTAIDMRLAYRFNIYAAEPLSRGYLYIDAHSGKVLLYDAIIKHASVPTTVNTRYAGNRVIYTKQISGTDPGNGQTLVSSHPANDTIGGSPVPYVPGSPTYVLIDETRGNNGGIQTYDLNNVGGAPISVGALYAQAKSFTDVGNYWTLPEHRRAGTGDGDL